MTRPLVGILAALFIATPVLATAGEEHEKDPSTEEGHTSSNRESDDPTLEQSSVTIQNLARIVGGEHPNFYDQFSVLGTLGLTIPNDQFTLYISGGLTAGGTFGEDHHLHVPQPGRYVGPLTAVEFHIQGPLERATEASYFRFGVQWSYEFWNSGEETAAKRHKTRVYLTGTPNLMVADSNKAFGPRLYGAVELDDWNGEDESRIDFEMSLAAFLGNRKNNGWLGIVYTQIVIDHHNGEYDTEATNVGLTGSLNFELPKHRELYVHAAALWGIPTGEVREDEYKVKVAFGDHNIDVGIEAELQCITARNEVTHAGVIGVEVQIKAGGKTYHR